MGRPFIINRFDLVSKYAKTRFYIDYLNFDSYQNLTRKKVGFVDDLNFILF